MSKDIKYKELTDKQIIKRQNEKIGSLLIENEHLKNSFSALDEWNRKAKKDAGYNPYISFDRVWEDALAALLYCRENGSSIYQWINVKDRLPKHKPDASDDVIAGIIKDGKVKRWGRANVGRNGQWFCDGLYLNWRPTHWYDLPMQLPQPPEDLQ